MLTPVPSGNGVSVAATQKQLGVLNHLSIGVVNMENAVTTLDSEGRLSKRIPARSSGKTASGSTISSIPTKRVWS